jgi:S1-C subfamily serine protease
MKTLNNNKTYLIVLMTMVFPLIAAACSPGALISDMSVRLPEIQLAIVPAGETDAQVSTNNAVQSSDAVTSEADSAVQNPVPIPADLMQEQTLLVDLYARINPSVVNITIYGNQNGDVLPFGQGSGFVFDAAGYIVTNAHVIDSADQVDVTFSDGSILSAEIVGTDLNSDLAVVKVNQLPEGIKPLVMGSMRDLAVGQTVIAIGNPFGLEGTLTSGIISALGRNIPALTPFSIPQSIQTDAAINPGNSGGPLLNLAGEVIGVNAQIETGSTSRSNSGVGFAIPVSIVKLVVPELIKDGGYEWSYLGVRGGSLTPVMVEADNLTVDKGAYIAEVTPDGPAARAGLIGSSQTTTVDGRTAPLGGDVVIAADGNPINSFDDLLLFIAMDTHPDQEVTLTVLREGKNQDVVVKLDSRPEEVPSLTPQLP